MNIVELKNLIIKHGNASPMAYKSYHCIVGCNLLEHITDVPGFVSLLDRFVDPRNHKIFTANFPDPINFILKYNFIIFYVDTKYKKVIINDHDLVHYVTGYTEERHDKRKEAHHPQEGSKSS